MDPACTQQVRRCPETSWAQALPTSRLTQASGHLGLCTQLCQESTPCTSNLTPALGSLGSAARLWDTALPASSSALIPGPGFTHQWVRNSSGVFWTLPLPSSDPALAQGTRGVLQPDTSGPSPTNKQPTASTQGRAWQTTGLGPNQAYHTACIVSLP